MRTSSLKRTVVATAAAFLFTGLACARNSSNDQVGAAQDSTAAADRADSTTNQSQSGVTDSSGTSTLGKGVDKTRPDQGQPVTSKGDTVNQAVDSSAAR
jgi:hypothetical protein